MSKKLIIMVIVALTALAAGAYFGFKKFSEEHPIAGNILFRIGSESLTIPEFEEFVKVGEEKSGQADPKRVQRYYSMLWRNKAIHAWNKKHGIDQLPEYQKDLKKSQEWLKRNPQERLTDRKDIIANQIKCMILIECWWRDIDNIYFLRNFPLFKPYIEKDQLSFDQFGALSGQMILDLDKELKTVENMEYLKRNGINGIEHLLNDIRHPELRPKKYEYAVTNSTFYKIRIKVYGGKDEVLSEVDIAAAKRLSENSRAPTNVFEIPIHFKSEEQKKVGAHRATIMALDAQGKALQEKTVLIKQKYGQGNFQIMIDRPEYGPKKEDVFHASIL